VSLRKVDDFFDRDDVDFRTPAKMRDRVLSTTNLAATCQKTVRSIQDRARHAISLPVVPRVKASASVVMKPMLAEISDPRRPSLKDLGLRIGHGKGPRIFVPRPK